MARTLTEFTIDSDEAGEGYTLNITTEDGETIELTATYEQLDLIAEAIEERLDEDEEGQLAVEGEES